MIADFVKNALAEDIGRGDLYARVSKPVNAFAKVIAKSSGIFAGEIYLTELAKQESFELKFLVNDGETFKDGDTLLELRGLSHTLLTIERTLLNILLHASSIATHTNEYVRILEPYGVKLLDTRKTRPHLRNFEKYATRIGGGINHRMGLDDSLMLKDTHLKTIENLDVFMAEARKSIPFTAKIEIECESFDDVVCAMKAGADIVMCDNMAPDELGEIVRFRNEHYPSILLEASGNITLETIEDYAKTGIDAISTGATIHQSHWIDLSMKMQ